MPNRIILLIIKAYRSILAGLFIGFVLFCLYMTFLYKPVFTASTKMYIRNLPKTNIITDYGNNEDVKSQSGYSNPLFNINQIIESHQVADRVYDKIKVKYSKELHRIGVTNKSSWFGMFDSIITLKIEPSTDVIKVTLNWKNKEQTAELLDTIVDEFKTENLKISKDTEIKQRQFLDKQLIKVAKELRSVRLAIRNYREQSHSINNLSESQELTKARIGLEQQRELISSRISYETEKLNNLEDQIGMPNAKSALKAAEIGTDPYLVQLNQTLASMRQQYAKLSSTYTDNYPEVISTQNQIKSLTNSIKKRQREVLQKIAVSRGVYNESSSKVIDGISSSDAEKTALSAQLGTLKGGIDQLKSEEFKMAGKDFGLDELRKEEEALLTAYTSVKEKQLEATILENQIIDNIVVLGGSAVHSNALSSIIGKLIGFLSLGFLGALAFAWIKEEIEDKWVDSKEIEIITEKKVLGVIPWVKCQQDLPKDFIMENDSIMGVSYGNIVSSIISESYLKEVQAISFLSTVQSRGKSLILPNIALTLARMNRSVIIVDIDFIRPNKLFIDFNLVPPTNKPDIIAVIDDINRELRMHKEINNDYLQHIVSSAKASIDVTANNGAELSFAYLSTNKEVHNISDYVATRGFKTLIDFLKQNYEFVLIDTPSRPHLYPEFAYITEISDGVAIISAMETNREKLINLIDRVEKTNTCVLGIIAREEDSALTMYFNAKNGETSECTPICDSTVCNEKNI